MSSLVRDDAVASITTASNAFLALSSVYLESVESLTSLNLNAAREAVASCASATETLSDVISGKDYSKVLSEIGQPMLEKAVSHSRDLYGIMAKTQEELSTVIKEQLAHPPIIWAGLAGGDSLPAIFAKGLQ